MDFGLAKRDAGEITMTIDGQVIGTPAYMSPEQAKGESHQVDGRSDVYSLGVIFYELLTGELPFRGNTRMLLHQVLHDEPRPPRSSNDRIPRDLETICLKCLQKEAGRRYGTARGLADDLRRYLKGEPITARPIGSLERVVKWGRRNPTKAAVIAVIAGGLVVAAVTLEYTRRASRAGALVQALAAADPAAVPTIINELPGYRWWADPLLRAAQANAVNDKERLHASLALLPSDPTQAASLREHILTASPAEIMVIRQTLMPHAAEVNPQLWQVAEDQAAPMDQRLRALAALAGLDLESERWQPLAAPLTQRLVTESPLLVGEWLKAFQPVRLQLLTPLSAIYRQPVVEGEEADLKKTLAEFQRKSVAVSWLAEYAFDQPTALADFLMDADTDQYAVFWPPFAKVSEQGLPVLIGELDKKLPDDLPASDEQREKLAKRQANAAVALMRLGKPDRVWPILKHSPDPRVRSYLIHYLSPKGADAQTLVARFREEKDVTIRRALLLALWEYPNPSPGPSPKRGGEQESSPPFPLREGGPGGLGPLLPELLTLYRTHPDPGLHAAAEWLLRKWGQGEAVDKIVKDQASGVASAPRERPTPRENPAPAHALGVPNALGALTQPRSPSWFVNSQGQTFTVIPGPVEFLMGSPTTEAERIGHESQHRRRIGRSFALATTEVTVAQFKRFNPNFTHNQMHRAPTPDCPILGVIWYEAAEYCNWLSKQEGIPEDQWCYLPNKEGKYEEGMELAPDYLQRTGYRLPTEAEWEYSCRAEALTAYYYGETTELLPKYAWHFKNSKEHSWPVAALKPNDLGLFGMHGNVMEWCSDSFGTYLPGSGPRYLHGAQAALAPASAAAGGSGAPGALAVLPAVTAHYELLSAVEMCNEDLTYQKRVTEQAYRLLRGGAFTDRPVTLRCSFRYWVRPSDRDCYVGFRVARTYP